MKPTSPTELFRLREARPERVWRSQNAGLGSQNEGLGS